MKIVSSLLPPEELQDDVRKEFPEVSFQFFKGIKAVEDLLPEAEVFITYGEDLNDEYIQKAKNLKWIMVMSAGVDEMPLEACRERGILVTNARGIHKVPMAEFTLGMMLRHVKQMDLLRKNEMEGRWNRKAPMGELFGKTLLIIGTGAIGGEIARLAKAFQMRVRGVNRHGGSREHVDEIFFIKNLEEALPKADFIVSVLPSTPETRGLLQEKHFDQMKESAVFINIGRGDLVQEKVLLKVLEDKRIAHAYLDVFHEEPLPAAHPYWRMENVTVTPHLSSITKEYLPRSFAIFKHNLHTYIKNETNFLNVIDAEKGY